MITGRLEEAILQVLNVVRVLLDRVNLQSIVADAAFEVLDLHEASHGDVLSLVFVHDSESASTSQLLAISQERVR